MFGLLELLGHGTFRSAHCCLEYPDGPDGILSEISCKGTLNFDRGDGVLLDVDIDIQTASALAAAAGKDLYELHVTGSSGSSLTLYDFTRLRNEAGDIVSGGSYGRTECIAELVKAVRENAAEANLVTPRQAHNAQLIVNSMKESTKCKQDQNNTY